MSLIVGVLLSYLSTLSFCSSRKFFGWNLDDWQHREWFCGIFSVHMQNM